MSCQKDTDLIKVSEGFRKCMYKDTKGIPTICWGYNLHNANAKSDVSKAGGNYNDMINGGCTTTAVCEKLLDQYVNIARSDAKSLFGSLKCNYAQYVAVDMTYNMGYSTMSQFHQFIGFMKSGDWKTAASDGRGTAWCRQVGSRCDRDMGQLTSCC